MFKNNSVAIIIFCLLAIVGVGAIAMASKTNSDAEIPVRKAVIKIQEDQFDLLFDQVRAFADKYGFAVRIAPTAPTGKDFIVELWREDFKILAANPFDNGTFRVSIFNILGREVEESHIDDVVEALKKYTLKVEGAEFTEQPGNQR